MFFTLFANGQSYNTTGGIVYNKHLGLTFKQRVAKHTTVEAQLARTIGEKYYTGSILGAQHFPMLTKRLNFFIGGGTHFTNYQIASDQVKTTAGLSALAGLDFTISHLNIAWSMQFKHNKYHKINLIEPESYISVRYVFIKRRTKLGKWFKDKKYIFWKKKKGKK